MEKFKQSIWNINTLSPCTQRLGFSLARTGGFVILRHFDLQNKDKRFKRI